MSQSQESLVYKALDKFDLSSSIVSEPLSLRSNIARYDGSVTVGVLVHNGSMTIPSNSPIGTLSLDISFDGSVWFPVADAQPDMTSISPAGNTLIRASKTFHGMPGKYIRVSYSRTSGGGGSTSCTVYVEVK